MIVGFSGIGGAGKGTCISKLTSSYNARGCTYRVVVFREKLIWPRLARFFKKNNQVTTPSSSQDSLSFLRRVYLFLRDLFYFFDLWRIYLTLPQRGIVILDRSFNDIFIELSLSYTRPEKILLRYLRFFPSSLTTLYFALSAEESLSRKDEGNTQEELNRQIALFDFLYAKGHAVLFSAHNDPGMVARMVETYIDARLETHNNSSFFALRSLVEQKQQGASVPPSLLLSLAARNRMTWRFLSLSSKEGFPVLFEYGEKKIALFEKTCSFLEDIWRGIPYSLIKNDMTYTELPGDCDVLFFTQEDMKKAESILKNHGWALESISQNKTDAHHREFIDVDMHASVEFGHLSYLPLSLLEEDKDLFFLLLVASHAIAEMGLVTFGDVLKTEKMLRDSELVARANVYTKKRGWGSAWRAWSLRALSPDKYRTFPQPIPLHTLLAARLSMSWYRPLTFMKEMILVMRITRARSQGRIPFHDPWVDQFS